MNKYLIEFVGAFFLMLTVGIAPAVTPMAPLAIGGILMVMIFAGGHISGGHYNPAVSIGALVRGALSAKDFAPYVGAQLIGALAGAATAAWLQGSGNLGSFDLPKALTAEFLFTFALVTTVLNTATAKGTQGNSFYGLAIGSTVMVGAFTVGGISGGAFNPAVALGAFYLGILPVGHLVAYVITQLVAGVAAAVLFKVYCPGLRDSDKSPAA